MVLSLLFIYLYYLYILYIYLLNIFCFEITFYTPARRLKAYCALIFMDQVCYFLVSTTVELYKWVFLDIFSRFFPYFFTHL